MNNNLAVLYFVLMSAIYIAPSLSKKSQQMAGSASLAIAIIAMLSGLF